MTTSEHLPTSLHFRLEHLLYTPFTPPSEEFNSLTL
jgi:hypothetical protein